MKHKHAELIKAWADGAVIEQRFTDRNFNYNNWESINNPIWHECGCEYRIKPEPKHDIVQYIGCFNFGTTFGDSEDEYHSIRFWDNKLKLTFDRKTGKLKNAKVL